jgi:predicted transcriptional regulator
MTDDVTQMKLVGAQVPADLADQFSEVARANERSVSAELRVAIRAHIDRSAAKAPAA